MQLSTKEQKAKLNALEEICKEYITVYRDSILTSPLEVNRLNSSTHRLIIEPKQIGAQVNNFIEGKVTINQNSWPTAEFSRIILRTFVILKSLYKNFDITLTIPSYFEEKLPISEDTFRILTTYNCHIKFLDTPSFEEEEIERYNVYWSISNQPNVVYIIESDYIQFEKQEIKEVGFISYLNNMISAKTFGQSDSGLLEMSLDCDGDLKRALVNLVCAYSYGKDKYYQSVYLSLKTVTSLMVILDLDIEIIKQYILDICHQLDIGNMSFVEALLREISYSISKINALAKTSRCKDDMSYIDLVAIKMLRDNPKKLELKKED